MNIDTPLYKLYPVEYPTYNVVQTKILIPHHVYTDSKHMEEDMGKKHLKEHTKGYEWFTDGSPLYQAIHTGILKCHGGPIACSVKLITE